MSILTKEGIQKILNDDWLLMDDCEGLENCTVIKELARMALAAMDSEPVIADCDPEVYEKGASACLVAIPKETAEVICKGISAATGCKVDWHYIGGRVHIKALQAALQPAPEVDIDPVAFIDKQWTLVYYVPPMSMGLKIGDKLYRHAQPAPEYPETLPCPVLLEPGLRFGKGVKTILVLEAIQRRAEHYAELEAMPSEERAEYDAGIEAFKAMLPQPAPVVPDGYVLVPKEMTDEIGGAISMRARCCGGIALDIYDGMLAAANCSIPMISERWIPVSERMPEREYVLAADFSGKHYSPCQPNS